MGFRLITLMNSPWKRRQTNPDATPAQLLEWSMKYPVVCIVAIITIVVSVVRRARFPSRCDLTWAARRLLVGLI